MMSIKNNTEHSGNHHHHHDFMTNITTTVSPTEHVTSISSNSASIVTENVTEIDSAIHHHHFTDVKNTNEQFFSQISDHDHSEMKMWFHGGCKEVILFDWWRIESCKGMFISFLFIFAMALFYELLKWFRVYFQMWTSIDARRTKFKASAVAYRAGNGGNCCDSDVIISIPTGSGKGKKEPNGGVSEEANKLIKEDEEKKYTPEKMGEVEATFTHVYSPTVIKPPIVSISIGESPINRLNCLISYVNSKLSYRDCRIVETILYAMQILIAYWLMLIAMTFNVYLTAAVVLGAGFGHWIVAGMECPAPRSKCVCTEPIQNMENLAADPCH